MSPDLFHRVAEGGLVTYVFLGRVNATSILSYCNPKFVTDIKTKKIDQIMENEESEQAENESTQQKHTSAIEKAEKMSGETGTNMLQLLEIL